MSVRLDTVIAAAHAGRVSLPAELCGYIALTASEQLVRAPRVLLPSRLQLGEDGDLHALDGEAADDVAAEGSLRRVLSQMLSAAPTVTPALRRASARTEGGGVDALRIELEAALVPVNRGAARRALARMCREALRATKTGIVPSSDEAQSVGSGPPALDSVPAVDESGASMSESRTLPWVRAKPSPQPDDAAWAMGVAPVGTVPADVPRSLPIEAAAAQMGEPPPAEDVQAMGVSPEGEGRESDRTEPMPLGTQLELDDERPPIVKMPDADLQVTERLPLPRRATERRTPPQTSSGPYVHRGTGTRTQHTPPLGTALLDVRPSSATASGPSSGALVGAPSPSCAGAIAETPGSVVHDFRERMEADTHVVRCLARPAESAVARGSAVDSAPSADVDPAVKPPSGHLRSGIEQAGASLPSRSAHTMPAGVASPKSDVEALVEGFSAEDTRSEQELCLELRRIAGMKQA